MRDIGAVSHQPSSLYCGEPAPLYLADSMWLVQDGNTRQTNASEWFTRKRSPPLGQSAVCLFRSLSLQCTGVRFASVCLVSLSLLAIRLSPPKCFFPTANGAGLCRPPWLAVAPLRPALIRHSAGVKVNANGGQRLADDWPLSAQLAHEGAAAATARHGTAGKGRRSQRGEEIRSRGKR